MLMIAICDDETNIGADLERALIDIFDKMNVNYDIDVFLGGTEFVRQLESKVHYDLIFLDIVFAKDEINGVEVGRIIRDVYQNNIAQVVYISWEKKYAMQLFAIRPMDFLVKPSDYAKVEHIVRTYLKIAGLKSGDFTYKKGHDIFKVRIKDIVYLENKERKVIIHLADGRKEEFYGSLKEAYNEQLSKFDFLFIHASYVVNYDYVTAVKFNQLTLTDSVTPLPISQNRRVPVRENYAAIMKRQRI